MRGFGPWLAVLAVVLLLSALRLRTLAALVSVAWLLWCLDLDPPHPPPYPLTTSPAGRATAQNTPGPTSVAGPGGVLDAQ